MPRHEDDSFDLVDYRHDAADRRAEAVWCKCRERDRPGICPGWRHCPVWQTDDDETEEPKP